MLPSEQLELAMYRWIKASGTARTANVVDFYQMPGANCDYALIVERLKDLHAHGYVALWKIVGNQSIPFNQFISAHHENDFFGGGFVVGIAPGGRKFFEALEIRYEEEKRRQQEATTHRQKGEFSQPTLGLLRKNLQAMESDADVITPHDRQTFWRDELFDFDFAVAVIDLLSTYRFDWGAIIPDLYLGKLKSQTGTALPQLPAMLCDQTLRRLAALALTRNRPSPLTRQLRDALADDGFDSTPARAFTTNATTDSHATKEATRTTTGERPSKEWDVFISHASEDKESIAHALAIALRERGLRVWYDTFTLKLGDSLRESIDRGLATCRFGVVILSHHFFAKDWPQRELNGLVATEISGRKTILPVWHDITRDEVASYSPTLADKLAVSTSQGLDRVVEAILVAINHGASATRC
jgi:hypothetical protein